MNELMLSGIELMIAGMVIVYLFLALLVITILGVSKLLNRYFPSLPIEMKSITPKEQLTPEVVAAITAAVHQYRRQQR
jgi:oxaloacetate decarboxylase gamma subunit